MQPPTREGRFHQRFEMNWQRFLLQGLLISLTGLTFALASGLNSDAVVLGARFFSWLPVCGMVILSLGILECLDAAFAKEARDFYRNLQVGVLDSVTGLLVIIGVEDTPDRLSLLLTAFLLIQGIIRIVLTSALKLPLRTSTWLLGLLSVAMGVMIWLGWPTLDGWFLALCLSVEITSRGWGMMMFALWLRQQNRIAAASPAT